MSRIKKKEQTALEVFKVELDAIFALLAEIPQEIDKYDHDITDVPGGHTDWTHARTLKHVREQIEGALGSISSALRNTREKARLRRGALQ